MVRSSFRWRHIVSMLLILMCGLSACTAETAAPLRIGIVLFGDSRQPQVNGFLDGLQQLGYEPGGNVRITTLNAENHRERLPTLVKKLIDERVDLLVAAGGLEADAMRDSATARRVPVVVLYVNAITERHLVDHRRMPGWDVTGVDNLNAQLSEKRVGLVADLLPEAKRILILYYENIAPSRIGVEYAHNAAEKLGLYIDARAVTSREDIRKVMASLAPGDVDAMVTVPTAPIDNALGNIILPETRRLGLPLMTHSRTMAEAGALASYGANFYDMGQQAARLADKVMRGVRAGNIPFETPKQFTYAVNRTRLRQLNLQLPVLARSEIHAYVESDPR